MTCWKFERALFSLLCCSNLPQVILGVFWHVFLRTFTLVLWFCKIFHDCALKSSKQLQKMTNWVFLRMDFPAGHFWFFRNFLAFSRNFLRIFWKSQKLSKKHAKWLGGRLKQSKEPALPRAPEINEFEHPLIPRNSELHESVLQENDCNFWSRKR